MPLNLFIKWKYYQGKLFQAWSNPCGPNTSSMLKYRLEWKARLVLPSFSAENQSWSPPNLQDISEDTLRPVHGTQLAQISHFYISSPFLHLLSIIRLMDSCFNPSVSVPTETPTLTSVLTLPSKQSKISESPQQNIAFKIWFDFLFSNMP